MMVMMRLNDDAPPGHHNYTGHIPAILAMMVVVMVITTLDKDLRQLNIALS